MADPTTSLSRLITAPASKRESILFAAAQIFLQVGYGAASMDLIAKTAGVSKATVYAHFASKDALFAAIIEHGCRQLLDTLGDAAPSGGDVAAELGEIGRRFYDLVLAPEGLAIYRVVVAEATRFPELGRAFYDAGPRRTMDNLECVLRAAVERGQLDIREFRQAGEHFIGMIRGDLYLRRLLGVADEPSSEEVEAVVERAVQTFLRAYGPARR